MTEKNKKFIYMPELSSIDKRLQEIRDVLSDSPVKTKVYGFHINSSESDPASAVTYLKEATGLTPAYMDYTNDKFVWGSWEDAFFLPKPCMLKYDGTVDYYLDPDNYNYKLDGDPSDVANDAYAGNAMMEWGQDGQKIWYKMVPDADPTSVSVYISNTQIDKEYHAWSFINNDGDYVEHFYTPIYDGWKDSSKRMRSISGKTPTASLNASTERSYCRNNNTSLNIWDSEVFCDVILINLLLVLMGKSLDTQSVFGQGVTTGDSSGVINTGTGNTKGLFWGSSGTTSVVKVFGMENYWGNLWRRIEGLVQINGVTKYKLTRTTRDGSTVADYVVSDTDSSYDGYLIGPNCPTSNGYVTKQKYTSDMFIPSAISGSTSTYYCDYYYYNSGCRYAARGGLSYVGSHCGAWYVSLGGAASDADWRVAVACSCKPKV